MSDLSIVLCTYNEAHNIRQALVGLINKPSVKEIIIIDDNSTDGTANIINNLRNDKIKQTFNLVLSDWSNELKKLIYG